MLLLWLIALIILGILFYGFQRKCSKHLQYHALYEFQTAFLIAVQVYFKSRLTKVLIFFYICTLLVLVSIKLLMVGHFFQITYLMNCEKFKRKTMDQLTFCIRLLQLF